LTVKQRTVVTRWIPANGSPRHGFLEISAKRPYISAACQPIDRDFERTATTKKTFFRSMSLDGFIEGPDGDLD